ncbi:hypothetical protein [Primorskyibacter flagellatus]|uniref:Uncharacterized protein n=1 Tax=Primorskyibacter flagellatus TaxID=1387277 RepID=A0A1W2E417_9RHOB|nr:hypothetical protein [Primorskyibacter flagellatus]SMD04513.1 hypothetical protein SAMN06295998_1227 [Primorskyibacter flagellatus]
MEKVTSESGRFLVSRSFQSSAFRRAIFRFDFETSGLFKITCAYCNYDINAANLSDIPSTLFYEGFLIPIPKKSVDGGEEASAFGMSSDSIFCWTKLFRPQFRGSILNGLADGLVEYSLITMSGTKDQRTRIEIKPPNTLVSPSDSYEFQDNRFQSSSLNSSSQHANFVTFQRPLGKTDFLELIFEKGYKGYIY